MSVNNSDDISADTGTATAGSSILGSVKPENIIFISKSSQDTSKPDTHDIFSLEEEASEQGPAFKLSRTPVTNVPQPLLDEFLTGGLPEYLQSGPSRHVHVVVSTGSGTGLSLKFYNSILQPVLESWGVRPLDPSADTADRSKPNTYNLVVTQSADSVRDFARNLGRASQDAVQHTVVLLSGDGGVVEMLNGKAPGDGSSREPNLPLIAILPLGTGNALFYSLHKSVTTVAGTPEPSGLVQSLRTLFDGKAAPLPSFRADFTPGSRIISYTNPDKGDSSGTAEAESHADAVSHLYGAIVASYGFHSQLVWESDTPEYRKHGDKRFGMVAQELLKESHAYNASVELARKDGSRRQKLDRDRHAYILATVVSNLEKTFTISPSSRPLDGKLRLVHFGVVSGEKTMEIMMAAYGGGKHIGMKWTTEEGVEEKVGYDETDVVKITTREEDARWRKVCIDGTIVELPQGGSMTVQTEDKPHLQVLVDKSVIA
ncbi:ATP-NAD kinase-like domain-containing protein [Hypoxylon rubiginosum]|uniref:ATP-NAD kinase-like domain-containing protein n=1 Tax=Hypoxylon rubiginosum TaxID=110542 RepID=A0ACC0D5K0_9PEZI|nr:ATP-NAD kinase-like domain-containing protein [Hypoxylon rubiginosum]